jgi:hemoglobin
MLTRMLPLTLSLCLVMSTASWAKHESNKKDKAAAPAATEAPGKKSLFERLGGEAAIKAVVDDLVARAAADPRINQKFAKSDVPRVKVHLVQNLMYLTGGRNHDIHHSQRRIHRYMGVTDGEFDALVEDLVATLQKFNVPHNEKQELLQTLGNLRDQIVEVHTRATGTPLPANFKSLRPVHHQKHHKHHKHEEDAPAPAASPAAEK